MPRKYVKKQPHSPYSEAKLQLALTAIKNERLSIPTAASRYGIPYQTLYARVTGRRGKVKTGRGRGTALSQEVEEELANGLRVMEKWGFGLSRAEILELVQVYVMKNELQEKVPFQQGKPGEDWFLQFKKRHNLSIKKPQSVEYARRKVLDPFIINEYFNTVEKVLHTTNLTERPDRIWNLDETNFCVDPSRTKIVGAVNEPCTRTTSGPGRDNTTVLFAINAAGDKAPPLIIFKAANTWDSWYADPCKEYPGTVYAASTKGYMITTIFENFMVNTLLQLIANEKKEPAIIVYDGHATHISLGVIEAAMKLNITIIKLPAHSSDNLQPLDVAVFRSIKSDWDAKMVQWQRSHIGFKLPRRQFSNFIADVWTNVDKQLAISGFRKSGIIPFNREVIPRSKYHARALQRWDAYCVEQAGATTHSSAQNNIPSTSTSTPVTFESLLLEKIEQRPVSEGQQKKKRKVAPGCDVLTSADGRQRLIDKEILQKQKRTSGSQCHGRPKKTVQSKANADTNAEMKDVPRKRGRPRKVSFSSTDDDSDASFQAETSEDDNETFSDLEEPTTDNSTASEGDFWVVEFRTEEDNITKYYVGTILSIDSTQKKPYKFQFLRRKFGTNQFHFPTINDTASVSRTDMKQKLLRLNCNTTARKSRHFVFDPSGLSNFVNLY